MIRVDERSHIHASASADTAEAGKANIEQPIRVALALLREFAGARFYEAADDLAELLAGKGRAVLVSRAVHEAGIRARQAIDDLAILMKVGNIPPTVETVRALVTDAREPEPAGPIPPAAPRFEAGARVTWCLLPGRTFEVVGTDRGVENGRAISIREAGKPYGVTAWVPGRELVPADISTRDAVIDPRD